MGSNPTGVTKIFRNKSTWGCGVVGLTCDPVKVETAGSNPVIPATNTTAKCNALGGRVFVNYFFHLPIPTLLPASFHSGWIQLRVDSVYKQLHVLCEIRNERLQGCFRSMNRMDVNNVLPILGASSIG